MKKLLIMSIALVAIMATVLTVSAFAANTVKIDDVTIARYHDAEGNFNENYANVTVKYTVNEETEGAVDRLTFYLAVQDLSSALEGEEAKVIYIDEKVNPRAQSFDFTIELDRVRTAFTSVDKIDSKLTVAGAYNELLAEYTPETTPFKMLFKLGGTNVDVADSREVAFVTPVLYGDVDGKGTIMAKDSIYILRSTVNTYTLSEEQKIVADVDGNGVPAAKDTIYILRYTVATDANAYYKDTMLSKHLQNKFK